MATTHARARTRRARLGAVLALMVAVLMAFFALSPAANATGGGSHHRPHHDHDHGGGWVDQVELEVACAEDGQSEVWFTAETWRENDEDQIGNPHIDMAYQLRGPGIDENAAWVSLPWQSSWRFDADNEYWFDDLLVLPVHGVELRMRATAVGEWSDGQPGGGHLLSEWVTLPERCGCGDDETTTTTEPETTTTTVPETTTTTVPQTTTTTVPETTTTTEPETTTTEAVAGIVVTQTPYTPTAVTVGSTLPQTGSNSGALVAMALALITAGGLLVRSARVA